MAERARCATPEAVEAVGLGRTMSLRFLSYELRFEQRDLLQDGVPVTIAPKAFDVLCYLATHHDRVVPKSELMEEFWSAQVSEAALQKAVSQARKAVAAPPSGPEGGSEARPVIKTYHGRGFRFVAPLVAVTITEAAPDGPDTSPLR